MSTEQSKILAKLKNRSKGSYSDVKDKEAKAGGRQLPGGIKGGVAIATQMKVDETKNGDPYVYLYASVQEPEDYKGIHCGFLYTLAEDNFNSFEENLLQFTNDMKLLGFENLVAKSEDEVELIPKLIDAVASETVAFEFTTSNRAKKDGTYRAFIQKRLEGVEPTIETDSEPKEGYKSSKQENAGWGVDDRVAIVKDYFGDGEIYEGVVTSLNGSETEVLFDDGETDTVPNDSLTLLESSSDDSAPFETEDRVRTTGDFFGDGESYEGTIQVVHEDSAGVLFDDGETETVPFENLEEPG